MRKGFFNIIYNVIGIVLAVVLIGSVAMPQVFGVNQTGWDAGTKAIWSVLGIGLAAVVLLYIFTPFAKGK